MAKDQRLQKIAAEAYERMLTIGHGRADLADVTDEIEAELRAHNDIAADLMRDIAETYARSEDAKRTSATGGQGDLFTGEDADLDRLWPIGGGRRVRIRNAVRDDYLRHLDLSRTNREEVDRADDRKHAQAALLLPYMTGENVTVPAALAAMKADRAAGAR